jgi:hypothetical protein
MRIDRLLGTPKQVSVALWAELMRTRKASDGDIFRLQHLSGSIIHIERESHKLCIYGSDEQFSSAERLLDDLANECIEERLLLDTSRIGQQQQHRDLTELAKSIGVTIQLKDYEIVVLGRRNAVKHVIDTGLLKAMFVNDLPQAQLTESTLASSNGPGPWIREQTAQDQVSCVSTEASYPTSDSLSALFGDRLVGPWIPKTVPCTASSAPTTKSSSACAACGGQVCSFCGNTLSNHVNFCSACGQSVRVTPSIAATQEAALFAQDYTLSCEAPLQATTLSTVLQQWPIHGQQGGGKLPHAMHSAATSDYHSR